MKKHIGVALGLWLSLTFLSVSSVSSAATQIVGTKCVKAGTFRTTKNVRYQCKKSSQGLRWVKASQAMAPTSTNTTTIPLPTQPVTSLTDTSQLASSNLCKLQYSGSDWSGGLIRTGFPRVDDAFLPPGDVIVQVFPVDFPNLQWVKSPNEVLQPISTGVTDFYKKVSNGRLNFTWRLATATVRMPYNVEQYNLGPTPGNNSTATFAKEAILEADPFVDFSGADFVLILNPDTVTSNQIYTSPAQQATRRWATLTKEGPVFRSTFTSHDTNNNLILGWRIIAHEFAHGMGLPDLYKSGGPNWEYMGQFDLMTGTGGAFELTAWSKWQLSFISDNQVLCLRPTDEGNFWISHVSAGSLRPELVLIRESDTTAIAIEARRKERFDKDAALTTVVDGLLVYRVDTSFATGKGPLRIIRKIGSTSPAFLDSLLGLNDSITIGGQVIKTKEVGSWGHVVQVTRAP